MPNHNDELYTLWQKYNERDYWNDAMLIAPQKANRDLARDANPLLTLPTDEEIEDFYYRQSLGFIHKCYADINRAVYERDAAWLKAHIRYDQLVSLDIFELVTGRKVRGLSNKKLAEVFANL